MTVTYHYSKKLNATETQQIFVLPNLRNINIFNSGDNDIQIEFENDITDESVVIPANSSYVLPTSFVDVRYKCAAGETATFYLSGLKHHKS